MKLGKRSKEIYSTVIFICASILALFAVWFNVYSQSHFKSETSIQGIDCSRLTVEEAKQKIEDTLCKDISFSVVLPTNSKVVVGQKEYKVSAEQLEEFEYQAVQEVLDWILKEQNQKQNEKYYIEGYYTENLFTVNEESVRKYLATIPELNGENVIQPQDAYIQFNNDTLRFEIVPEVIGNQIDFEEACTLAIDSLKSGINEVNFDIITDQYPFDSSKMGILEKYEQELNEIMETNIKFELLDGTIVTLDATIIKDWIKETEKFPYIIIDAKGNLPLFLDDLALKAKSANNQLVFPATGLGNITLPIRTAIRGSLDKEAQYDWILQNLGWQDETPIKPIYQETSVNERLSSYIELDITRQTVWMYKDGKCILETPVVTGCVAKGHSTPTGIYYLQGKARNRTLTDNKTYWSDVDYWMPFNGGVGFHDAYRWRSSYGGDIYIRNGSHGCVNMPLEKAKILYENITYEMPIIIYKS